MAVLICVDNVAIAFRFLEVGVISVVATAFAASVAKFDVTKSVTRFKKKKKCSNKGISLLSLCKSICSQWLGMLKSLSNR